MKTLHLNSTNSFNYSYQIINIDRESRTPKYFVHYNGWNRKWDKWVDESTLSKKDPKSSKSVTKAGSYIVKATAVIEAEEEEPVGGQAVAIISVWYSLLVS